MISKSKVLFCGSFLQYSGLVLEGLLKSELVEVIGVITTPPQPTGKDKSLVKTPVHSLAEAHHLPVFTPHVLDEGSIQEIETKIGKPEILLTAGYGKLLPTNWLSWPSVAPLNLHLSLLPKYRGANPAEWALLLNEKETGITLIEMSPKFDTGTMIAAAKSEITPLDTRESIYQKLYTLGAETLDTMLAHFLAERQLTHPPVVLKSEVITYSPPQPQPESPTPYASRFMRDQAFVAWSALKSVMSGQVALESDFSAFLQKALHARELVPDAVFVERAIRALSGFPTLWTLVPTAKGEKRMKLIAAKLDTSPEPKLLLDRVQIEGKAEAQWAAVKNSIG